MAKNERKLTPAEQKRKEQFALVCEEMERQGYRKTDLTIGVVKANLLALIVMLPFAVLSGAVVLSAFHSSRWPNRCRPSIFSYTFL